MPAGGSRPLHQKRTSSGASEVQNRVYGKPPLKQLIRPQEYCGTGTGAKDVRKSVRFRTLSSSSILALIVDINGRYWQTLGAGS